MFKLAEDSNYMMPVNFGGAGGRPPAITYHDVTSIQVAYETDSEGLAAFIPEPFQMLQPVLAIQYSMCRQVDWMTGGGYNLISVGVPVVHAHGGERIDGLYVLIIWENRTAPILTGREQTGMPKIFADIEDHHQLGDTLLTNASYEGSTFLKVSFRRTKQMSPDELKVLSQRFGTVNAFGWRYIPNIGRPGAALSHATLFPQEFVFTAAWQGEGKVHWNALAPQYEYYPMSALAGGAASKAFGQLPIKAYGECLLTHGSLVLRSDLAKQLS